MSLMQAGIFDSPPVDAGLPKGSRENTRGFRWVGLTRRRFAEMCVGHTVRTKAFTVIQELIDAEARNKDQNGPRRGREARREERYPLACVLQISWQRAGGESCTTRATCREVG